MNSNLIIGIIGSIVGICGVLIAVLTLASNTKKNNVDDGKEFGEFMGEIRARLQKIEEDVKEIKEGGKDVQNAIDRAIEQHEKRYHSV